MNPSTLPEKPVAQPAAPTIPKATPLTSTVSAKALVMPPAPVSVRQPVIPPPPAPSPLVAPVRAETDNLIKANTAESQRLQELRDSYSLLNDQSSMGEMFSQERQNLGIDTNLKELKDIQLRLTDMNTASDLTKTRIEGAAGQTLGQGQREVTQEYRENAVRTTGLAARAAVLQGNIETATALARDTVDMAFKDRQVTAQNLINQISDIRSTVDEQTGQLLEQDKRKYEAELASIKELKDNIATAMVNGASQAEIGQLNDPAMDDASKLKLAQSITARGATQMRNLEVESQRANIAQSYASTRASNISASLSEMQMQKQKKIDEAIANGAVILDDGQRKDAYTLSKDFEAESKDFKTRVDAFNQITTAATTPSAAGDVSLIYGYMKMLDPNSVVRETEFATAENAAAVPERVRAQYNKAMSGERLTESIRTDFVENASDLYDSSLSQQMQLEERYKLKATDLFNLPPQAADLVVQDIRAQGAVSEVALEIKLNSADDEQLGDLVRRGLIVPPLQ